MSARPLLLDLFSGALCHTRLVERGQHDDRDLPTLRAGVRVSTPYPQVLLQSLRESVHLGENQDSRLSTLWRHIYVAKCRRREQAVLLAEVLKARQLQERASLAEHSSRDASGISRESTGEESELRTRDVLEAPRANSRTAWRRLCGLWRDQSVLVTRRFHPNHPREPVPTSSAFQIHSRESRAIQTALRQPSLRTHAHRKDRGHRHHAIRGEA